MTKGLFGKLTEYVTYPRVYFIANDADFAAGAGLPADAFLKGEEVTMNDLFGFGRKSVRWDEIVKNSNGSNIAEQQRTFLSKWLDETTSIILAARDNKFIAPQTVLIGRGGRRFRFLLYGARIQADGSYCCEFLAIDEVGGPPLGLSRQLLSLLTSIRLGFRFRYELIEHFPNDFEELSAEERQQRIVEIPRILYNLTTESDARGNASLEDLLGAFDDVEAQRIRRLVTQWPTVQREMFKALGLSEDGTRAVCDQGLLGPNLKRYRTAFEAARLINIEFLSRCCGRLSRTMLKPEEELSRNAQLLEQNIKALTQVELRPAA
jgi:hypothetical protein